MPTTILKPILIRGGKRERTKIFNVEFYPQVQVAGEIVFSKTTSYTKGQVSRTTEPIHSPEERYRKLTYFWRINKGQDPDSYSPGKHAPGRLELLTDEQDIPAWRYIGEYWNTSNCTDWEDFMDVDEIENDESDHDIEIRKRLEEAKERGKNYGVQEMVGIE